MDDSWIEHRRPGDCERLGWIEPVGEGFVAIDLLGRRRTEVVDWMLAEVSSTEIRVKKDDWGDMTAPQIYFTVPFPASDAALRPLTR